MGSTINLAWLYVVAGINFLVGAIIWFRQREELSSSSPDLEAVAWSATGTNLMGFAVLVFVIAIAANAIVEAIRENVQKP